jgi:hypothetical protein
MLDQMRWVATLVLAAAAAAPAVAAPADIAKLADITTAHTKVVVRGELPRRRQRELVALATAIIDDVETRFSIRHDPAAPITLLLFTDATRYRTEALALREPLVSELGFYAPDRRTAIANVGNSVGNMRHELVHPLLGDDFAAIPSWLNEGIAALYGSSKVTRRGVEFLVNYRLRDLQRALRADALPTLAELVTSGPDQMYGDRAMVFYALARYVLLYVDRQGKLAELYGDLRAAKPADHAKILASYVDEKAYRTWARKLRY